MHISSVILNLMYFIFVAYFLTDDIQAKYEGSLRRVVVNVLDCDFVVSEFKF